MRIKVLVAVALAASPAIADQVAFDVTFRNHVQDSLYEQDVYVLGSRGVVRPGPDLPNLDASLFASAEPQAHAPGDPDATGPFPKGAALGVMLSDWLNASGTGHYRCENGEGQLQVTFEDLVPNGIYTVWHFFMANGVTEPFIGKFDLPVGAFDGSQSVFTAGADGKAIFDQTFASCLQLSGPQLTAGLALNWHSDGQTYGVLPGMFGHNAHIQLYTDLPVQPGS